MPIGAPVGSFLIAGVLKPLHLFARIKMNILNNKSLLKDCAPDQTKYPAYGYVKIQVDDIRVGKIIAEINSGIGTKEIARTKSQKQNLRKVKLWRIPVKSYTGETIKSLLPNINEVFNYKICSLQDIQYLEYSNGDYYEWHSDIDNDLSSMRKISISLCLNGDYTGGNLEFFNDGQKVAIETKKNDLIAFTSFLNHRVNKVRFGVRKVIVCWVKGDSWR